MLDEAQSLVRIPMGQQVVERPRTFDVEPLQTTIQEQAVWGQYDQLHTIPDETLDALEDDDERYESAVDQWWDSWDEHDQEWF